MPQSELSPYSSDLGGTRWQWGQSLSSQTYRSHTKSLAVPRFDGKQPVVHVGAAFSSTTYPKIRRRRAGNCGSSQRSQVADACILIFEEKNDRVGKTVIFDS